MEEEWEEEREHCEAWKKSRKRSGNTVRHGRGVGRGAGTQ
jgi:hypothetical protein